MKTQIYLKEHPDIYLIEDTIRNNYQINIKIREQYNTEAKINFFADKNHYYILKEKCCWTVILGNKSVFYGKIHYLHKSKKLKQFVAKCQKENNVSFEKIELFAHKQLKRAKKEKFLLLIIDEYYTRDNDKEKTYDNFICLCNFIKKQYQIKSSITSKQSKRTTQK